MSVKSKFPFDMVWSKDQHDQKGFMVRRDGYYEDRHDYLEGEGVYASAKSSVESFGNGVAEEGRCKKKGTATVVHNAKEWSRRRRKSPLSCLKTSSISTDDCFTSTAQTEDVHTINTKQEIASKAMVPVDFSMLGDFKGAQNESSTEESSSKWFSSDEFVKESKANIALQEHGNKVEGRIEVKHGDENAMRLLEQALEEEQTAHAALYLELEKERSAAASAADEAMAMILRLREEKAIVEMNARQYKRMVEEKSVFDAEEMNLLKEILLRRERETHYLEKEVEAYRRMMVGNVQLDCQRHGVALEHAGLETRSDTSVSQMELLGLKWNDYVKIAEQGDNNFEYDNYINHAYLGIGEEGASSMQEKVIVLQDTVHSQHIEMKSSVEPSLFEITGSSQRSSFQERTITPSREKLEHEDEISTFEGVTKTDPKDNIGENIATCGNAAYSRIEGSSIPADEAESHVYDVHVVDCHQNMSVNFQNDETECGPENISITCLSECNKLHDAGVPTTNTLLVEAEENIVRSQTDISLSSPPLNTSIGEVHSAMRRNSMSSVDCERLRIESEVGLLREKMRIVQEGRRKLKLSVDLKEREKVQLQVLDDMANQLQEIRHKTSPEKVARQSSLPPQPSKVSRKRNKVPLHQD